jgi:hypothetical protein
MFWSTPVNQVNGDVRVLYTIKTVTVRQTDCRFVLVFIV